MKADIDFQKDLFDAANKMRGSIAPADYKHYVLPLIFLRYLSNRYELRCSKLVEMVKEPKSDWCMEDEAMRAAVVSDPDQYKAENVFVIPAIARWS